MNTHLLIPIKDIENRLKDMETINYNHGDNENHETLARMTDNREKHVLKSLLKGKQISLDEKDMDMKSAISVSYRYDLNDIFNEMAAGGYISGYKQALLDMKKDLL